MKKQRSRSGLTHCASKSTRRRVTQEMIDQMAELRRQGLSFAEIGARVGCSDRTEAPDEQCEHQRPPQQGTSRTRPLAGLLTDTTLPPLYTIVPHPMALLMQWKPIYLPILLHSSDTQQVACRRVRRPDRRKPVEFISSTLVIK